MSRDHYELHLFLKFTNLQKYTFYVPVKMGKTLVLVHSTFILLGDYEFHCFSNLYLHSNLNVLLIFFPALGLNLLIPFVLFRSKLKLGKRPWRIPLHPKLK